MYCSKCGSKIPDESVFCNQCGFNISVNRNPETSNNDSIPTNATNPQTSSNPISDDKPTSTKSKSVISKIVVTIVLIFAAGLINTALASGSSSKSPGALGGIISLALIAGLYYVWEKEDSEETLNKD